MRFQIAYDCASWLLSIFYRKFDGEKLLEEQEFVRYSEEDLSFELLQIFDKIKPSSEVELIFSCGPGSFTGLRVNAAAALAFRAVFGDKARLFAVNLKEVSKSLGRTLFVKITHDDYGEISSDQFRFVRYKNGLFLSGAESIEAEIKKNMADMMYIYCDLDDDRFGCKLLTDRSIARVICDMNSLWCPVNPDSLVLDYGTRVSFKKYTPAPVSRSIYETT